MGQGRALNTLHLSDVLVIINKPRITQLSDQLQGNLESDHHDYLLGPYISDIRFSVYYIYLGLLLTTLFILPLESLVVLCPRTLSWVWFNVVSSTETGGGWFLVLGFESVLFDTELGPEPDVVLLL